MYKVKKTDTILADKVKQDDESYTLSAAELEEFLKEVEI